MKKILLLCLFMFTLLISCNNSKKDKIQKIVSEWMGKTILIPETEVFSLSQNTIEQQVNAPYKILVYTDSVGCISCKLRLETWNYYIQEADSLMAGKLDFVFFFHPKDEKELELLFRRDKFNHTVYIDREAEINRLNSFPPEIEFQCFLLDKDNKVLSIGNPTLNPKIWELFKSIINSGTNPTSKEKSITSIAISDSISYLPNLAIGKTSEAKFNIKNTGNSPLIISHIASTCGCIVPNWNKKPIMPDEKTEIVIETTPEEKGYFRKTVTFHCNTKGKTHSLIISGETKE